MPDDTDRFRLQVVSEALRLFAEKGYEATTVDEIAEAAGISRRTFFRQFRAKEDVVFADHEILLEQAAAFLDAEHEDPWAAVCEAAMIVFERFSHWRDVASRRYAVVHEVPALRDREIVTGFRYERLFVDYLRARLPDEQDLTMVQFAAAVTATHNYLLRRMVRDGAATTSTELRSALAALRRDIDRRGGRDGAGDDMVVAVFPRGTAPRQVADLLQRRLELGGL
ncbi:TetR family transcriptional regulator [Rhodococcus spelaei]|uniref:TetR family transcriptional regulator n=1 Tax=Rhodococcus spelaei TaxID=2546320 RepID=A0A541B144_9NOCA|nr:TetR family transcriptional regulator [Rhodococcus spelaei]TQF66038.1 TetR family transcriptional regulator [Rhodococcus spelaei]